MQLETILKAAINSMVRGHHRPHCFSAHVPGKGFVNRGDLVENREEYLEQLERRATAEMECMEFCHEYAEPGYDDPEKGIVFANWNVFPRELPDILERAGYATEWSDEWDRCGNCYKAFRISPDSYLWKKSYVEYPEDGPLCKECVLQDLEEYESFLLNSTLRADAFDVDWAERGFRKFNEYPYESGWHPHQTDDPNKIVKELPEGVDYLFSIGSVGQFDIQFDCWIREKCDDEE